MSLTPDEWHQRFQQQARWTRGLRNVLLPRIQFPSQNLVLDIGCGTGAITGELIAQSQETVLGGDIDRQRVKMAMRNYPEGVYFCGDAHRLPFPTGSFDVTLNHFLLLWTDRPNLVIKEMARVTKPGGYVLALAEPDYGGRIDYPPPLDTIRDHQISSLHQQGADPVMGRKLREIFHHSGLKNVTTGVFDGKWDQPPRGEDMSMEWKVLEEDLGRVLPEDDINTLKEADLQARENGRRILYLPTFYAWGKA